MSGGLVAGKDLVGLRDNCGGRGAEYMSALQSHESEFLAGRCVETARKRLSIFSLSDLILGAPGWAGVARSIFCAVTVFPLTVVTMRGSLEACLVPSDLMKTT